MSPPSFTFPVSLTTSGQAMPYSVPSRTWQPQGILLLPLGLFLGLSQGPEAGGSVAG